MPRLPAHRSPMKSSTFDQPGSLLQITVQLIKKDGRKPAQLCRETGINPWWIYGLLNGKYKNPSVNRIQFLYEHISGQSLLKEV